MTDPDRRDDIDWQAWEVDDLPESFADDVLDAIDAGAPADDEVAVVIPTQVAQAPRRRAWLVVAATTMAAAAAAALLWWGAQPSEVAPETPAVASFDGVGVTAEDETAAWRWLSTSRRSAVAEQSKGRVRWDAQRGVPLTVQTPAGRVSTNRADFTLEVLDMSISKTQLIAGAAVAGTVATLLYLHAGQAELSNDEGTLIAEAPRRAVMTDEKAPHFMSESSAAPKVAKNEAVEKKAPVDWKAAKVGIQRALEKREAAPPPSNTKPDHGDRDHAPEGALSKEYIRDTVREEVVPLVRECYNNLLENDPDIAGRMVLQFAIMGDESVGGIVDEMEFGEDSEIQDEDFRECVSESMMSTVFDPPEGGGKVVVTYPFAFTPEGHPETEPAK